MNIEQVNTTLDRSLLSFHEDTEEALVSLVDEEEEEEIEEEALEPEAEQPPADARAEDYTGVGGTEPVDHSPTGDPETGDVGGVDNYSHEMEAFLSYVAGVADDCAGIGGYSHDATMDGLEKVADEMAAAGEIPSIPNPDTASSEELSGFVVAATTAGLAGRLAEYMKANAAAE